MKTDISKVLNDCEEVGVVRCIADYQRKATWCLAVGLGPRIVAKKRGILPSEAEK